MHPQWSYLPAWPLSQVLRCHVHHCLPHRQQPRWCPRRPAGSFIQVFRDIGQYRFDSTLGAWIKTIVVRTSLKLLSKNRNLAFADMDEVKSNEMILIPDTLNSEYLEKIILSLPDGYRTVFLLTEVEGYTTKKRPKCLVFLPVLRNRNCIMQRKCLKPGFQHWWIHEHGRKQNHINNRLGEPAAIAFSWSGDMATTFGEVGCYGCRNSISGRLQGLPVHSPDKGTWNLIYSRLNRIAYYKTGIRIALSAAAGLLLFFTVSRISDNYQTKTEKNVHSLLNRGNLPILQLIQSQLIL